MRFSFGHKFEPYHAERFARISAIGDEIGLSMLMMGDSPALIGDHFIGLTLIAQNASRARIGSFVTNPLTRHPVVMASAISSVNALSGGRAFLGLSSGDSGVYNLGLKPCTQAYLEHYILTLKQLFATGEAIFQGSVIRFNWAREPIPIYMAPGGPKGLRLAGRIADGVFLETGFFREVIEDTLAQLAEGAAEAGRSLKDIDVWWHARVSFGSSREDAIDRIRSGILGIGNRLARFQQEGKFIPDDVWMSLQELKRRYDFMGHDEIKGNATKLANAHLLEELGLTDYLADRFAIVGTPDDWVKRIESLRAMGVENIALAGLMPDKEAFLRDLGEYIIPKFICA